MVRAYVEAEMYKIEPVRKLYYMGPMFRRERPQKGTHAPVPSDRRRSVGARRSVHRRLKFLLLLNDFFRRVGLDRAVAADQFAGLLRSAGRKYRETLLAFLKEREESLCDNCRRRIDRNPLRALDCKEPGCIRDTKDAPSISIRFVRNCREHFRDGAAIAAGDPR